MCICMYMLCTFVCMREKERLPFPKAVHLSLLSMVEKLSRRKPLAKAPGAEDVAHRVESLPNMHEDPGSIPSTTSSGVVPPARHRRTLEVQGSDW